MKLLFTPNTKGLRKKAVCRTWRIFLLAAIMFHMLSVNRLAAYASEEKAGDPTGALSQEDFDFGNSSSNQGNLDTDGYEWNLSNNTLRLKDKNISGTVTLPDDTVTIETTGNCTIGKLAIAGGNPQETKLTFSGKGQITIESRIEISGGDNNGLTVAKGAHVVANNGVSISTSGGKNSLVTVNGTLTAKCGIDNAVIYTGKVVIGNGGQLNVSGQKGVLLMGVGDSFTGVFVIERGGSFSANCESFNMEVETSGTFPEGTTAEKAISIPEGYLPVDCGIKLEGQHIDLVKKSTGEIYTGALTIQERLSEKPTENVPSGEETPAASAEHHSHSGGTATCVSGKICELCGTEYTERDGKVHVHTEICGKKAAACTLEGYTGDTFCKDCNTKISSGRVIPATGHDWQVTDEEEATASLAGKRYFTCSKCGETREEAISRLTPSVIEKDEKAEEKDSEEADKEVVNPGAEANAEDEVQKTEQFRMPWWILLAAFALIIGFCWFFLIWKKKKGEKEEEKEEKEEEKEGQ